MESDILVSRIEKLERTNRRMGILLGVTLLTLGGMIAAGFSGADGELKATKLTIVDDAGRARIVLAGAIPDPIEGKRRINGPGMQILNESGYEQFGLLVDDQGGVGMGFDARPGAGDDRNRERINLWVTPNGSPGIRLMDGKTRVKSLWFVDEKEEAWLGFLKWEGEGKETKYTGMRKLGVKDINAAP